MMPDPLKVFILGPARSGTSIMYYAMREVFGLPGRGESHVMPIFQRVASQFQRGLDNVAHNDRLLASSLSGAAFQNFLCAFIQSFYLDIYKDGQWIDKTPGPVAIESAPLIRAAFPSGRMILTQRSGIEVVSSHMQKFGSTFESACLAWSQCAAATAAVIQQDLGVLVVEQHDLTNTPDVAAQRIAEHLGRVDKAGELTTFFTSRRVGQLSSHNWDHQLTLEETSWSEQNKDYFRVTCGGHMQTLGYPS